MALWMLDLMEPRAETDALRLRRRAGTSDERPGGPPAAQTAPMAGLAPL